MKTARALEEFLADHRARGSRPKTIHWYGTCIPYLLKEELDWEVDRFTTLDLNRVLGKDGLSVSSLANYDRALRGFFNWMEGAEILDSNPFRKRKRVRESFKLKQVLTAQEIQSLFDTVAQAPGYKCRNRALLGLMLECGLRAGEIARLRIDDVNWTEFTLQIDGKTGFAVVPLSRRSAQFLRHYVTHERKTTAPELFVHRHQPLTTMGLSHWLGRAAKRAGIARPVGPHLMRHTFATHFLRSGGDAFSLRRILRHTSMSMTMRYVNFVTGDLSVTAQRHSPLSSLKL